MLFSCCNIVIWVHQRDTHSTKAFCKELENFGCGSVKPKAEKEIGTTAMAAEYNKKQFNHEFKESKWDQKSKESYGKKYRKSCTYSLLDDDDESNVMKLRSLFFFSFSNYVWLLVCVLLLHEILKYTITRYCHFVVTCHIGTQDNELNCKLFQLLCNVLVLSQSFIALTSVYFDINWYYTKKFDIIW